MKNFDTFLKTLHGALAIDKESAIDDPDIAADLVEIYLDEPEKWDQVEGVLKHHKLFRSCRKKIKEKASLQRNQKYIDLDRLIIDSLSDAPVSDKAVIPPGYLLSDEDRFESSIKLTKPSDDGNIKLFDVCPCPVVISKVISNITTGDKGFELAWKSGGKWRTCKTPKSTIDDTRKMISKLSDKGFPVSSHNKSLLAKYLSDYLHTNVYGPAATIGVTPHQEVSQQLGWQPGDCFLLGDQPMGGNVGFVPPDVGDKQLADAVSCKGDLKNWLSSIEGLDKYPRALIGLYASFAAPLLKILGAPNFIVDYCYSTSTGKSSVLNLAASIWGTPNYVVSWGSTQVYLERAMATRNDMPFIADETKLVRQIKGDSLLRRMVYMVANGKTDGRGSIEGTSGDRHFRTILISSGEYAITDVSHDGGTISRVIPVWGMPFNEVSSDTSKLLDNISSIQKDNYGVAGKEWIDYIQSRAMDWDEWINKYIKNKNQIKGLIADMGGDAHIKRLSSYLSVLHTAVSLVHECFDMPFAPKSPVTAILDDIVNNDIDDNSPKVEQAYQDFISHCVSHQSKFFDINYDETQRDKEPWSGWIGRWDSDSDEILIPQKNILTILTDMRYDARSIVKLWKESGKLSKVNRVIKLNQKPVKVFSLKFVQN